MPGSRREEGCREERGMKGREGRKEERCRLDLWFWGEGEKTGAERRVV